MCRGTVPPDVGTTNRQRRGRHVFTQPSTASWGAGLADPAQTGSALSQGCQAARGGDGPCADPLEASEARSAASADMRKGLRPNGRDGKNRTERGLKSPATHTPIRLAAPPFKNRHKIYPKFHGNTSTKPRDQVSRESIDDILNEFRLECQRHYICFFFSAKGASDSADEFENKKPDPEARLWISDVNKSKNGTATIDKNYASISVKEYLDSSKYDGAFPNEIAKSFICAIYSLWDEKYRNLMAKAAHVEQKKISSELMGDLRHIRNCIVHSKSIITSENEKIKAIKWSIQKGELKITGKMFRDLIDQINEMPIIVSKFSSPFQEVQEFYDSLTNEERTDFDGWIHNQKPGTDIKEWPQWASATKKMPWLPQG